MALKYGLKLGAKKQPPPARKSIFEDDDDRDDSARDEPSEDSVRKSGRTGQFKHAPQSLSQGSKRAPALGLSGSPPRQKKNNDDEFTQDASSAAAAERYKQQAEELDPSIFDYDSYHDAKSVVTEAKKAAERQEAIERKPKYIHHLMESAARRKQDQLVAREKLLQKERDAEGDEFADKEKFVTGAYKAQQEEARRLEEEERRKAEGDEERRRRQGGGLNAFYKSMIDESERRHQEEAEAAEKVAREGGVKRDVESEPKGKTDAELVEEFKQKGINVHVNDEGLITDKRQLLSAGLNVAPSGSRSGGIGGADHLRSDNRPAQPAYQRRDHSDQQAQRERQSRMIEEQLAASAKRAREEQEEEQAKMEKAAKSQKSEKDVSDAKARYLARKAAKARGED